MTNIVTAVLWTFFLLFCLAVMPPLYALGIIAIVQGNRIVSGLHRKQ